MRLFEYQGKELFSKYGIRVPRSKLAGDESQALSAVEEIGLPAVIKAQVLSGGRGKAGGVVLVRTKDEAKREARRVLGLRVGGEPTRALLVEEASEHTQEMYLSVSLNRGRREFVALASRSGGTEVESLAKGAMVEVPVPLEGLTDDDSYTLSTKVGLYGRTSSEFRSILLKLERLSQGGGVRARGDQPARSPLRRESGRARLQGGARRQRALPPPGVLAAPSRGPTRRGGSEVRFRFREARRGRCGRRQRSGARPVDPRPGLRLRRQGGLLPRPRRRGTAGPGRGRA